MSQVLLVDDEPTVRQVTSDVLIREGYEVLPAADATQAEDLLRANPVDLVVTDLVMPGKTGYDLLAHVRTLPGPYIPVLVITGILRSDDDMRRAFELGVDDYILKPFSAEELCLRVKARLRMRLECIRTAADLAAGGRGKPERHAKAAGPASLPALDHEAVKSASNGKAADPVAHDGDPPFPIRTPAMDGILAHLHDVRASRACVLFTGETGTGKSVLARYLHDIGPRRQHPFVVANCSAFPATLLASELFGCERGAFTGAGRERIGRIETAHHGTLFLDEIGDIGPDAQVSLLRFLEERESERLGSSCSIRVDVRVVAATNCDLPKAIDEGRFRRDLFYRLNVVSLEVPPLRDRPEDILVLSHHFLVQAALRAGKSVTCIDAAARRLLQAHPWPGNIRELANVIERAVLFSTDSVLGADDLCLDRPAEPVLNSAGTLTANLEQTERQLILQALDRVGGNHSRAARELGVPRTTLLARLRRLGIRE
ncbi:MAG: sigma-54-dependent Fis family transcriptional regulator [Candidatus Riflebacteria bacterium]|nr:sigma-54-dependent Fis family transcriptional regulator [Candidatus Riflebacteria bacterium]